MKVFFHFCTNSFTNCYIVGEDDHSRSTKTALVIDPGCMDEAMLKFIETNDYQLRAVLVTHDHDSHVRGLRTLKRIYDAEIYALNPVIREQRAMLVHDGDILEIGPFQVYVYSVPGHSSDSIVYRIDSVLFTGDVLSAGLTGKTVSSYGQTIQAKAIRSKLFSLPGDYIVLPGHGPPTTLETERRFNLGLEAAEKLAVQRRSLVIDDW